MAELKRGIKAGIVAGLIYGVVYALFMTVLFYLVASLLGIPTSPPPFGGQYVALRVDPFMALIFGPIFGIILGVIYAFTINRLPGRKLGNWSVSRTKGIILALLIWIIVFLIVVPTQLRTGLFFSELGEYRAFQILMTAMAAWLFILVLGQQLGNFWDKFKPK